jgi:hypothetical protein
MSARDTSTMRIALEILVILVLFVVPVAVVGYLFVWAAKRDGEEDKAVQRRLGIRRRTRLGR